MSLAELQSIGLDELVEKAALQTRIDRKYVLSRFEAAQVLAALDPSTRVLEIAGARASSYESVYFDTPDLLSYRLAATARRRRFKIRTRSYVDTAEAWLEVKTRGSRSSTVKDRVAYDIVHRDILTAGGREYTDAALDGLGLNGAELDLRPTLVTRYHRTTLFLPASASRATIDTDLSWEADDGHRLSTPDLAIIETKSGVRTSEIDRLLWSHGHRPTTISKFGTGLAALRSDLPSHKWARVLRRYFR
ncbi:MAG: polyphosphate polymerase domain-containing protein [Salinibacterium sp.]|nr:polyphosphate polymerase domain-containing protein [Salinibacterium sp.]